MAEKKRGGIRLNVSDAQWLERGRMLVRVHRAGLELGHVDGRVVGHSAKLIAISIVDEGIRPNGFVVYRRADISKLEAPAPYMEFMLKVLGLRHEKLPRLPKVDLSSWQTLVDTAARRFPLLTLHLEKRDPDICYIGRPVETTARRGTFVTIAPDAVWDRDELLTIPWVDVTRMDFGGGYEEALALAEQH
jgi:hypothetical protein